MPVDVETLCADGVPAAYVIRGHGAPGETVFPTPADLNLQVGFVGRLRGETIDPHVHHDIERHIVGTMEVLLVVEGRCELDIYDADRALVATAGMAKGDIVLLVSGGHGIRVLDDTVLFEVKQGPYGGLHEKERFSPS